MAEPHSDEVFEYEEEKRKKEELDPQLQEFMEMFSAKDAILEQGIAKSFEQYVDFGGSEEQGVSSLAGSYVGLPNMVNVMIEWLHAAGYRKREIQNLIEDHLKMLIVRNFDTTKADLIFTEETPSWLEEMIQYPTWRELFYQLSEQYPDCLMLKFTIKLISDAGFQSEITNASTASHQPEVFSGLFKAALLQLISSSPGAMEAKENLREFTHLVCHSQQTYFYSLAVLQCLHGNEGEGEESGTTKTKDFQRWLEEEMQLEAQGAHHEVTNMTLNFMGAGLYPRLFEALAAMLSRNALNPADISILHKLYSEPHPPPASYLHIPQLLELLVQTFFKPGSAINPDHKEKYLHVLAYAVSSHDDTRPLGSAGNNTHQPSSSSEQFEQTKKAVETAHMICSRASVSHAELQVEIPTLFECMKIPVVSMGVVRWVEHMLTDSTFFEEAAESSSLFLVLLDEATSCHALQHPHVLELLKRLIEGSYPTLEVSVQMELKKSLVEHMVHLLSCGYVLPVVDYVSHCMQLGSLDHSHIRHFVSEVLSVVQRPYSQEFSAAFEPLVHNQEITAPLVNTEKTDAVSVFLDSIKKTKKKRKGK